MTTPYNGYRVDVINPDDLTVTEITNVQEISISVGRRLSTGQWPTSTCRVVARYPTGYNAPIAGLGPDSIVRVWGPGRYPDGLPTWIGYVQDCAPMLGIPWNSTTNRGEADLLTLSCEGQLAFLGRGSEAVLATLSTITNRTMYSIIDAKNVTLRLNKIGTSSQNPYTEMTWPNSTDEYNRADFLQRVSQTSDGKLLDGVCYDSPSFPKQLPGVFVAPQSDYAIPTVRFSDTTNNATNRKYDQIEFGGLANNYFTRANITTLVAGSVTMARSNGLTITEPREVAYSTYNSDTGRRDQLGRSLINTYSDRPTTPAPIMISALASVQHTDNLDSLGLTRDSDAVELALLCRAKIEIVFRGTTHYANIEGVTLTATPDDTRFTYYLTPRAYADWLILDDSTYGKLDTGRLAFA